ncbi:hypothetical protein EWH70_16230 [Amycolatopsis suaedae]|uniref:Regulator of SigK n=1 Tax=Amycolatopsis suaedae TaxID=2510978 RepID=A0A4Q7JAP3_9PSEU|nr:hypothetical protein EWH70_16230 [Amycolatopsis suaedae]
MHALTGAYALDALTEHERAQFERHLAECPSCAQEVRELTATAARLGSAVAEEPPPALRDRVLAEIGDTRQVPPIAAADRVRRRAGAPRWAVWVSAAAAVAGLAAAGIFGGIALDRQGDLDAAQRQLADARQRYAPMGQLLAAPDVRTVHAVSATGGSGTVLMSPSLDRVAFLAHGLPERAADRDYQVWLMPADGSDPRSIGLVTGGSAPGSVVTAQGLAGVAKLGLTVEPRGGSPRPTTQPILVVPMRT